MASELPIRWAPADEDLPSWRSLATLPGFNTGFREATLYHFELPSSAWSMRVDDEPLPQATNRPAVCVWSPKFFAGEVTAEVRDPVGRVAGLFLLDVSPDPLKLGRDVFDHMVRELWAVDPSLVLGEEPGTVQTGELGAFEDPWIAFARLRRHAGSFIAALKRIAERPRLRLSLRGTQLHFTTCAAQIAARQCRCSGVPLWRCSLGSRRRH